MGECVKIHQFESRDIEIWASFHSGTLVVSLMQSLEMLLEKLQSGWNRTWSWWTVREGQIHQYSYLYTQLQILIETTYLFDISTVFVKKFYFQQLIFVFHIFYNSVHLMRIYASTKLCNIAPSYLVRRIRRLLTNGNRNNVVLLKFNATKLQQLSQ